MSTGYSEWAIALMAAILGLECCCICRVSTCGVTYVKLVVFKFY